MMKRENLVVPVPEYMEADEAVKLQEAIREYHKAVDLYRLGEDTTGLRRQTARQMLSSVVRSRQGQSIVSALLGYC